MIRINFIPQDERKAAPGVLGQSFGPVPAEIVVGIMVAVLGSLFLVHMIIVGVSLVKIAEYGMLQKRWKSMAEDKKVFGEVSGQIKVAQERITSVRPILSSNSVIWSAFMKDVGASMAKGVALKQVSLDKGVLVITGSAVSQKKNEMVLVGQFVTNLRQKKTFEDHFTALEVDYFLQRQEAQLLSVANFNLKAKLK